MKTLTANERAVLAALTRAADAGAACPSNTALCDAAGILSPGLASELVGRLEALGLIRVERLNAARCVTIVATGHATQAVSGKKHWRQRDDWPTGAQHPPPVFPDRGSRMIERRLILPAPTVALILARRQTLICRAPTKTIAPIAAGDRLWIAEPIQLPKVFDGSHPTSAALQQPLPPVHFAADGPPPPGFGARRFAREMPRAFCRLRLDVREVRRLRILDLTLADVQAAGRASIPDFQRVWDEEAAAVSADFAPPRYADNPEIVAIGVTIARDRSAAG